MGHQPRIALLILGVLLLAVGEAKTAVAQTTSTLEQAAAAWADTFLDRDAEAIASYFSEDVVAYYPGWDRPLIGRVANQEAWARYFSRGLHKPMAVHSVVASSAGDLGYVLGQGLYAAVDDPEATGGRYVTIWRQVEGEWKIVVFTAHNHVDVTPSTFRSGRPE